MAITAQQARAELARRELARRQEMAVPEDNENLLQKVVRYGVKDPAIGLLNMGREFANLPNKVSGGRIPEFSPSSFNFGEALGVNDPGAADNLIQGIGQYAPAFMLPGANLGLAGELIGSIPKVGSVAARVLSDSIPQALYGASQAPKEKALKSGAEAGATMAPFSLINQLMTSKSPVVQGIAKGAGYLGGGYLGREAAKTAGMGEFGSDIAALLGGGLVGRALGGKRDMQSRLTEGVDMDVAIPRIKAAEELGLDYLTPAEAGVSPWAAKQQGALGRTAEGGKMLYQRGLKRQDSERRAIEKTLDQIYNPATMDKQVTDAYKAINEVNLPQEFPLQFKDNEIINEAKRLVEKTPAYKESLKELMPKNVELAQGQSDPQATSLLYWDHIKRAMDDMVSKAERTGNKNEARIISNTRADMRNQMDEHFPEYKEARALYERKMVRDGLEKVFDRKEINGRNFYAALASQKKFDEVLGHLKNAPEAAENLKKMRLVFDQLMGPPTIKTAKGTEERGMNQDRNTGAFMEQVMEHAFTRGGNDKAAIEFITSPTWAKQLDEIKKIPDKRLKMAAFALTLSKGASQYAGNEERAPLEMELVGGQRR